MPAERITNQYDLMDAAEGAEEIRQHTDRAVISR
jgi:hypothetical protein